MRTNSISPSFKAVYVGYTILEKSKKEGKNSEFSDEVKAMMKLLQKNNINKKENVDVILQHNGDCFYGVISSKTQGTPMHPDYRCKVSEEPKTLERFKKWVDTWNSRYS